MIRSPFRPARRAFASAVAVVAMVGATSCNQSKSTPETAGGEKAEAPAAAPQTEPPTAQAALPAGHIEVQHVLIGFQGSVPGKPITRTQDEAKALAYQILERAKKGESFDALVQQHTDDQYPGIYRLADNGVTPEAGVEYPRSGMVKGFGDASFPLAIGGVGIADYDKQASPYGWHIVKRLR